MAEIKANFGEGGTNLTPAGQGSPTLAEVLRDVADDLSAVQAPATAAPSSAAVTGPTLTSATLPGPEEAMVNDMRVQVDLMAAEIAELRSIVDGLSGQAIKTIKV